MSLYLLVNLAVISIPLGFSWHSSTRFARRWRDFGPACLIVLIGFIAWDVPFAANGIWGFNDAYLLGPRIAGLPLEEWMFFICIPYACVFTYHALNHYGTGRSIERFGSALSIALLILSMVLLAVFPDRWYTALTCALLIPFLVFLVVKRPAWIGRLWVTFLVLVVPFVLTNGVLTGLRFWEYPLINMRPELVADQIVWYDNAHNIGVRLFSVPFDDFLYAFLLIGLNVALFEYFGARRARLTSGLDPVDSSAGTTNRGVA